MNGWAKLTGALTAVAGIVFILGIVLAISDGCDFGDCRLECFACNDYFTYFTFLAGMIAAVAGLVAIGGGIDKNCSAASILGISLIAVALIVAIIPFLDDASTISWNNMEVTLAVLFILLAAVEVVCNAKLKVYGLAIAAVLLAFCVDAAYLLDLYEGMVVPIIGAVIIILAGVSFIFAGKVLDKADEAASAEEVEEAVAEERVIVPAPAPVAAKPYVAPAPKEEAEPAKPAAKPVAKAAPAKEEAKPAEDAKKAEAAAPAKEEAKPTPAPAKEEAKPAEDAKKAEAAAAVVAAAAAAPAKEEVKEESELDKLLAQGWKVAVANVGEDRANEMSDYEIMAVISIADPELYQKLSLLTGIVVSTGDDEVEVAVDADAEDYSDLGLEPDTPAGFLRRACWNRGLRCRKDYGPYYIPVAFVKSKVAVYIDGDKVDDRNDEALREDSWVVLHFKESDITDGDAQAQIVHDAVKENTRALKKAKAKKAKKKR